MIMDQMPTIRYLIYFIFGLIFGSFGNVLIYRIPKGMSILKPPSSCPSCNQKIMWYDNIPILSFLLLKGKCRYCGARISLRYPLVEISTGILFLVSSLYFDNDFQAVSASFLLFGLFVATIIDIEHMIIPDKITLPLAGFSILVSLVSDILGKPILPLVQRPGFLYSLYGILFLTGAFFVIEFLGRTLYKKESIGMGDVKLGLSIGVFLGKLSPLALIIAYIIGTPIGIFLKKTKNIEYLPFGPFLALGSIITLFWGERILNWYLKAAGLQ